MIRQRTRVAILAALLAMVLAGTPAIARAEVIAQSILDISNFLITASNPDAVELLSFANTGNVLASLDGTNVGDAQAPTQGDVNLQVCTGDCGNYSPGTELLAPDGDYAGATSVLTGFALAPPGAQALTDTTVSLETFGGEGTAAANLGLVSNFDIEILQETILTFSFTADAHLIASIFDPQAGDAIAQVAWSLTIVGTDVAFAAVWFPNAPAVGFFDVLAPCNINTNVGVTGAGTQTSIHDCEGFFTASVLLGPGNYNLTITHTTNAAAASTVVAAVPAPSALLILGLGLAATGWLRWRRPARV